MWLIRGQPATHTIRVFVVCLGCVCKREGAEQLFLAGVVRGGVVWCGAALVLVVGLL